jgi:hypothetical protein
VSAVTVAWSPPLTTGGAPITGYRIESSKNAQSGFTTAAVVSGSTQVAAIPSLTNGVQYYFRVIAINSVGESLPSEVVAAMPLAAPSGQLNCAVAPSGCGLPDETNTGVVGGTPLTRIDGDVTVTVAGTVIEGKDIRGCVRVLAPNVTIRNSKVTCTFAYAILIEARAGGNLLVEDVEVDCLNSPTNGIGEYGVTVRRVNIHGCGNGLDIDGNFTVEGSYIHDLYTDNDSHADGIQLTGGSNIIIAGNTIYATALGTSAIISHPTNNSDVLITGNLLAGGAYTLYCPQSSSNFRVIDNRFSTIYYPLAGTFGPWTDCQTVAELSGNVWDTTLEVLPSPF